MYKRQELEWAKRGCRARSTKQRARLERLEALKNGKAPVRDANVELDSVETRMGKKTIELHHISKSFGEKKIRDDCNYIVLRNQRLGIIGPNGCGKSTPVSYTHLSVRTYNTGDPVMKFKIDLLGERLKSLYLYIL